MFNSSSSNDTAALRVMVEQITPMLVSALAQRLLPHLRAEMKRIIPEIVLQTLSQQEAIAKRKKDDGENGNETRENARSGNPPSYHPLQEPFPRPLPQPPSAIEQQSQVFANIPPTDRRVSDEQMLKKFREYEIARDRARTREVTNAGVVINVALKPDGSHYGVQEEAAVDWRGVESEAPAVRLGEQSVDDDDGENGHGGRKET